MLEIDLLTRALVSIGLHYMTQKPTGIILLQPFSSRWLSAPQNYTRPPMVNRSLSAFHQRVTKADSGVSKPKLHPYEF